MVISYDIDDIYKILKDEEFFRVYNEKYKNIEKNNNIFLFLEKIKKNKNYHRLNINTYNNLDSKINIDDIKRVTNNINKLTNVNKDNIFKLILENIKCIETSNIVVNILIDCIITNTSYSDTYIELLKLIVGKYNLDLNLFIDKFHDLLYKNTKKIETSNYYNLLCEKNKCTDNSIGYSLLIVKLENNNMIEGKICKILKEIKERMNIENLEDFYKFLLCIYNIFSQIKDKDITIVKDILEYLKSISLKIKSKKIQFKIVDISELFI